MNIAKISNKRIKFRKALRARGVCGVMVAAVRLIFQPKATTLPVCTDSVAGRNGLEIGGSSLGFGTQWFSSDLSSYCQARQLQFRSIAKPMKKSLAAISRFSTACWNSSGFWLIRLNTLGTVSVVMYSAF